MSPEIANPFDDVPPIAPIKSVEVTVPVVCQNGHSGTWRFVITGLEVRQYAPRDACACPTHGFDQGWRAAGEPVVTLDRRT